MSTHAHKRVQAIIDQLAGQFPRGTLLYRQCLYGWQSNVVSDSIALVAVDYSLQDIGGDDDEVRIFGLGENTFDLTIPANTLPAPALLPRCQAVHMSRFTHGLQ
jgi:hypothetical protein